MATGRSDVARGGAATPTPGAQEPRVPSSAPAVLLLLGCVTFAAWWAAQALAAHYRAVPALGRPWLALTPPVATAARAVAVLAAGGAATVAVGVGRRRVWGPGLALGCAALAAVAFQAAREPLYGPLQGLTWVVRLHALTPSARRPTPAPVSTRYVAAFTAPPRAVRGASGRLYYPRPIGSRPASPASGSERAARQPASQPVGVTGAPSVTADAAAATRAYWTAFVGALALAIPLVFLARPPRRRRAPGTAFGTAAWDAGADLAAAVVPDEELAASPPPGLLIGRAHPAGEARPGRRPAPGLPLHYRGDGHLITIAPTRSGKGVSAIVPNLLTYQGSVVVTDPKGENYALTSERRKAGCRSVVALDPFGVTGATPGAYNPLDLISDPRTAFDDANTLADMLVVTTPGGGGGGENVEYFDDEARALLGALILYVSATAEPTSTQRSLPHVRELLTGTPDAFRQTLKAMAACGTTAGRQRYGHVGTLIARGAARLEQKADKERSGVISTAQRHTHFLDSEQIAESINTTTVSLADLPAGTLSLYLVLPTDRLGTYRAWLRLMIGACIRTMVHQPPARPSPARRGAAGPIAVPARQGRSDGPRVLFALDEFANLKRLTPVEEAFTIAAGYGVTFWLFLQDLSQLKTHYRSAWSSFLANADVLQTFGSNDLETAKLLSELTGDATILVESENASASVSDGKGGSGRQSGTSTSLSEKGRRLLTPHEVRLLGPDEELLVLRGRNAIRARKLDYRTDPEFAGLAGAHPFHTVAGEELGTEPDDGDAGDVASPAPVLPATP